VAVCLIVAAGRGERLGSDQPKAFVALAGASLLERSLATARAVCDEVVVALPPETPALEDVRCVAGGATRSHSVRNALAVASPYQQRVVVHDAARPLAPEGLFRACLDALGDAEAAVAAAPVVDTIKEVPGKDHRVARTLERRALWTVQTPQAFRRGALEAALDDEDDVLAAATDDAWLVERAGGRVVVVPAPRENLKITTPLDLEVAGILLTQS
jgi:2-C-methyl-D-erythritol 4-phosphate cytidylyltransferase